MKNKVKFLTTISLAAVLILLSIYHGPPLTPAAAGRSIPGRECESIGLVLSGGGAWGLAHIGALEVLDSEGIEVDMISGTSAGAIVGALYAEGYSPAEMQEIISKLQWSDFIFPTLNDLGFFSIERVEEELADFVRTERIEDLPLKFSVTVTDIDSGEAVSYSEGPLARLLAASASVPILFAPVEYQGLLLADGGMVDNLPVAPLQRAGMDCIIAVDVAGNFSFTGRPEGMIEYGNRVFNIMRRAMQADPEVDILIQPDLDGFSGLDFDNYELLIDRGFEAAVRELELDLSQP